MAYKRNFLGQIEVDMTPLRNLANSQQSERTSELMKMMSLGNAGKILGAVGQGLGTLTSIGDMAGAFGEDMAATSYTAEREQAIDKKRTNTTINAGMAVANLVLSLLATFGSGGAALPALIGSGIQMATNFGLNTFNNSK